MTIWLAKLSSENKITDPDCMWWQSMTRQFSFENRRSMVSKWSRKASNDASYDGLILPQVRAKPLHCQSTKEDCEVRYDH